MLAVYLFHMITIHIVQKCTLLSVMSSKNTKWLEVLMNFNFNNNSNGVELNNPDFNLSYLHEEG